MKILVYSNRKQGPIYWDASTPEKESAAILVLFRHFDEDWEFYSGLSQENPGQQWNLYNKARSGDVRAAIKLLNIRKAGNYEYENSWYFDFVQNPLGNK